MASIVDQYLFTQIGLDSGSLTILGAAAHGFSEPGEYRGVVRRASDPEAVFYISADPNSPAAHVNIDLSALTNPAPEAGGTQCCQDAERNRFSVNPKGFVLFHVSGGVGGYSVHVRKAQEGDKVATFDSRELGDGDFFAATIIRPGVYSVVNTLSKARNEIFVPYPARNRERPYRPPTPVLVEVTANSVGREKINVLPAQGIRFQVKTRARIKIELIRPDDGPGEDRTPPSRGWEKTDLSRK